MRYDDIKNQLERYGGEPVKDVLPILNAVSSLNDDISHIRSRDCISHSIEKIKVCLDQLIAPSPFEQHPDDAAVDRFSTAMKAKLAKKRADGVGGWDDPDICHIDYLVSLLLQQIHERAALDPVDIANLSMMIHERGETPEPGR